MKNRLMPYLLSVLAILVLSFGLDTKRLWADEEETTETTDTKEADEIKVPDLSAYKGCVSDRYFRPRSGALRIGGSTSFYGALVEQNAEQIDKAGKFHMKSSSSGRGIKSLAEGKIDVAMISAPLSNIIKQLNKEIEGNRLSESMFQVHEITRSDIAVIVNRDNPLVKKGQTITLEELVKILEGEITDWQEIVGRRPRSIQLVTEDSNGGVRIVLQDSIMKGKMFWAEGRRLARASQINNIVKQYPNAIGIVNASEANDTVVRLKIKGLDVKQPLALVTKGAPSSAVKVFIDAVKRANKI